MRTLIDGYPLADDDPDFEIQTRLNDYLSGPANERSFGSTAGRVLGSAPMEERRRWLMPLLRRAEWLVEHPQQARPHWAGHLMCAVHLILNHAQLHRETELSERELLTLLGYSGVFRQTNETGGLGEFAPRAVAAFRKTADKGLWVQALESACFELEQFSTVYGGRIAAQLGMALMIDPAAPEATSPCWSATVAAELRKMSVKAGAGWRALLVLADTALAPYPREPQEKKLAAALKKIPAGQFAAKLDAWTLPLERSESPYLSWRGAALLKILLHGAASVGGAELQTPLTRLARAEWRQPDRARLALDLLVTAIVAQPVAFSRGCLEALAKQSYATDCAALNVALSQERSAPQPSESPLGVDGFPLDERPAQAVFQHRLDEWLRLPGTLLDSSQAGPDLRSLALREEQPDYAGLLAAMLDRIDWINRHRALVPKHAEMARILTRYLAELQRRVDDVDRDSLLRLMGADTKGALYCSPGEHILETVERYVERHGFDVELVNAIEAWHKAAHGSIAEQTLRRHLGWLLWREDVKPVNLKACWSSRMRQDLREMPEARKKLWRELLAPMTFHICNEPPAKWKKQTAPLLKEMGAEEFAAQLHRWFRPFGEDQPLPLEAAGADVLRCLLWHAAEVEDARVDEALLWFSKAEWKSKKSKGYTTKLLGPYVFALSRKPAEVAHAALETLVEKGEIGASTRHFEMYRGLCEKLRKPCLQGAPAPAAPTAEDGFIRALKKAGCEVTDETVMVPGHNETYLVDRKSREIRRLRDGALLTLDATAPMADMLAKMFQTAAAGGADLAGMLPLVQILKMDQQFGRFLKVSPADSRVQ